MREFDLQQARHNMIEQQIRPWEVLDQRVLDLMEQMPRDMFVPAAYRGLAYADVDIPIGHDQVIMAPKLQARLLQSLNLTPSDTVLEVGTGTGFLTALLARSARHVYSVDYFADFVEQARERLKTQGITNITLETGDASQGWGQHGPYDAIAVTGSLPVMTDHFSHSLKLDGRLFVVVGEPPIMEALLITRTADRGWHQESLFDTDIPPLINAPVPQRFVF